MTPFLVAVSGFPIEVLHFSCFFRFFAAGRAESVLELRVLFLMRAGRS